MEALGKPASVPVKVVIRIRPKISCDERSTISTSNFVSGISGAPVAEVCLTNLGHSINSNTPERFSFDKCYDEAATTSTIFSAEVEPLEGITTSNTDSVIEKTTYPSNTTVHDCP